MPRGIAITAVDALAPLLTLLQMKIPRAVVVAVQKLRARPLDLAVAPVLEATVELGLN